MTDLEKLKASYGASIEAASYTYGVAADAAYAAGLDAAAASKAVYDGYTATIKSIDAAYLKAKEACTDDDLPSS